MKIPVIFLNKPTKNNRIYPREVVEKALEKYRKDFISEQRALIQKRLPMAPTINLLDAVGVVHDYSIEGDTVFMECEFLHNVEGATAIEEGIKSGKLHLRAHGMGTITKQDDGTYKIGPDYEFISCFATDEPA